MSLIPRRARRAWFYVDAIGVVLPRAAMFLGYLRARERFEGWTPGMTPEQIRQPGVMTMGDR